MTFAISAEPDTTMNVKMLGQIASLPIAAAVAI
jgi:hypothetical protein